MSTFEPSYHPYPYCCMHNTQHQAILIPSSRVITPRNLEERRVEPWYPLALPSTDSYPPLPPDPLAIFIGGMEYDF